MSYNTWTKLFFQLERLQTHCLLKFATRCFYRARPSCSGDSLRRRLGKQGEELLPKKI